MSEDYRDPLLLLVLVDAGTVPIAKEYPVDSTDTNMPPALFPVCNDY